MLRTLPAVVELGSLETQIISLSVADVMLEGEVVSNASAVLTDLTTGLAYPGGLSGSAGASGTTITQSLTALVRDHHYQIRWVFTVAAGKVWEYETLVTVPI